MNFFAHGWQFTDDPYFLAGTAAPDWLCVADRGVRVRSKNAAAWTSDHDPRLAASTAASRPEKLGPRRLAESANVRALGYRLATPVAELTGFRGTCCARMPQSLH
jgi:hypothetical protein